MAILTVGTGLQYATAAAAIAASHDGDTIYVKAGTYLNESVTINTKISIVGVGGMAHFTADKTSANGKGFFVTTTDVTFDHIEFSKASVIQHNGAGIRHQGGALTVTNSFFHDSENGILVSPIPGGSVTIDRSEFAHNGFGDGLSHNIYVGMVDSLVVTNSYLHDAVVGHELKSRAAYNLIDNNRIINGTGSASYNIDLPNSGIGIITNNILHQGKSSQNPRIISYGAEQKFPQWANSSLLIQNNTIINELTTSPIFVRNGSVAGVVSQVVANKFYGLKQTQIATGLNTQSNNTIMATTPPAIDTSHPWSDSTWDNIVWSSYKSLLYGTSGRDLFVGGAGKNTFVIVAGQGSDSIADFRPGTGPDVVQLLGYGLTDFVSVKNAMTENAKGVVIDLGNGESLTIHKARILDFTANDFAFNGSSIELPDTDSPAVLARPVLFTLPASANFTISILGDRFANTLTGTAANERLSGGLGNDTMIGGAGDDSYTVQDLLDVIVENPNEGIDSVESYVSYTLPDNVENFKALVKNLTITGNASNNSLKGYSGNDIIDGKDGNDILIPYSGADILTGGNGRDIFAFQYVDGKDVITDFHVGEDLIDLRLLLIKSADPMVDGILDIVAFGDGSKILVDLLRTGTMVELVEVQHVAPTSLYLGYDILL